MFVLILFFVLWLLFLLIVSCAFVFEGVIVNSVVYCCFSFLPLVVEIYVWLFVLEVRAFCLWLLIGLLTLVVFACLGGVVYIYNSVGCFLLFYFFRLAFESCGCVLYVFG